MRTALRFTAALCLGLAPLLAQADSQDIPDRDPTALADAIRAANARPGADTLRLAEGGLYPLTQAPAAGPLLPVIEGELVIEGRGAELRRYVDGRFALLAIAPGARVILRDLTLAEGTDGALHNFGDLQLEKVRVMDSIASTTPAIVLNHGTLRVIESEFAFNALPASGRDAGTLLNFGHVTLDRSSIHDNLAQRRYASLAAAGAVLNLGVVEVKGLSLADNRTDSDAGGLAFDGILNLGNGRVSGDLAAGDVSDAGRPAMLAGNP